MRTIIKYELLRLFRDKKTIFFIFILPLIIFPVINGGLVFLSKSQTEKIVEETIKVAVQDSLQKYKFVFDEIRKNNNQIEFSFLNVNNRDSLINNYHAVITADSAQKNNGLTLYYSSKNDEKTIKSLKIISELNSTKKKLKNLRYRQIGIKNYDTAQKTTAINIADRKRTANYKSINALAISIILVIFFGTYTIAGYIILGEKDNKTLEALLLSGAKRKTIIYSKFAIILSAGFTMAILELISFYLYGKLGGMSNFSINLRPDSFIYLILIIFSYAVMISSFAIFMSCKLKSSTMGQMFMMPLSIIIIILAFGGILGQTVITKGFILFPVLNSSGYIKMIIMDDYSILIVFLITLVSLLYTFVLVKKSENLLEGEGILEDTNEKSLADISGDKIGYAITSFAVLTVTYFEIGGYLQGLSLISGLIISQIFILGIGAYLIISPTKYKYKKAFRFNKFSFHYLITAIILGLFVRFPISYLKRIFMYIFPLPSLFESGSAGVLEQAFGNLNIVYIVLISALLPAIFEELVFRGTFLTLIERKQSRSNIKTALIVGVMFGAMHLNIFQFFETSAIGFFLTYLALISNSIFPSMILHFTNNASSMILLKYGSNSKFINNLFESEIFNASISVLIIIYMIWVYKRYSEKIK